MPKVSDEDYEKYVSEFLKQKEHIKNEEERLSKMMSDKLGITFAGVSIIRSYETDGDPMSKKDYVEWMEGKEERERIEKETHEKRIKEIEDKNKEIKNTFNTFISTLPQAYSPKEWRDKSSTLNIKKTPIPRGTKEVIVSKGDRGGIKIEYKKD
jgi:hypothetical protein